MDKINVYDFDDTIYDGQSWIDFVKFCIKKNPIIAFYMLNDFINLFRIRYHFISSNKNYNFCHFLKKMDDAQKLADDFWEKNRHKIKVIYINQGKINDVIVTTSPEFFLIPLLKIYKFDLIGTKVNIKQGTIEGKICYGEEKIRRFKEIYGNISYDFYSDDIKADSYMINESDDAYLVKKNKILKITKKY